MACATNRMTSESRTRRHEARLGRLRRRALLLTTASGALLAQAGARSAAQTAEPYVTVETTTDAERYAPTEEVAVSVRVANPTTEPVTLTYSSGQQFDVLVYGQGGELVWQWSADKFFTQAI